MAVEMNATVTERRDVSHGLCIIRVKPDFELPEFRAGQYGVLGLPGSSPRASYSEPEATPADPQKIIKRAYSVASSSLDGTELEFYVALVPSGALTPRLFALDVGDRLWVGKKIVGMFTLDDVQDDRDVIFVATGTGLAPYISMLRSAYDFDATRRTTVFHGARHSWELGYRNELESLADRFEDFVYHPILSDPEDEERPWEGLTGFIHPFFDEHHAEDLLGGDLDPQRHTVFLCGNPLMIEAMLDVLTAKGFKEHKRKDPGNIILEKFW